MRSRNGRSIVRRHALLAAVAIGSVFAPVAALAQTAENAADAGEAAGGDEIIITAQKRAANIQDVPLSVAAIAGETLENRGIDSTSDIARLTPGVAVSSNGPGRTQVIIRGISSISGSQATTGFYLDEVPVAAIEENIEGSLFDLERVEVLRGPQGTLYGSASMGGAIKYISNQPDSNETEGRIDATLSSTNSGGINYGANGVINLPLVADKAALRVVGFYKFEDGYIDRYAIDPLNYLALDPTVEPKKDVNSYELWGFRATLGFTPTETTKITPSVYYQKLSSDGLFSFDDPPGSYSNMVQGRLVPDVAEDELQIYNLTASQEFGNDFELTSSTSYFIRTVADTEDASRVIFFLMDAYFPGVQPIAFPHAESAVDKYKIFTQELRMTGEVGPVEFLIGAYYQHLKRNRQNELPLTAGFNAEFGTPFPGYETLFRGERTTKAEEKALFGQLTWNISDRFRVTGGLRYFKVNEKFDALTTGVFNGGTATSVGDSSSSGVTPKISIDYNVTDDVLVYASAAKGFRAGGALNPVPISVCAPYLAELGLSSAPTKYDPDSLWSYEVGAKSQFADRRVTLNAAAYHIDWSKIQQVVSLQCGFAFTANFGSAVSRGFEVESSWRVTDGLTFGVNAGYNDAYLKETVAGTEGQKGDRLLNVPKFTASGTVDYEQPVSAGLTGFLSGSFSHVSKVLAEYNPTSAWPTRKAYQIVDLRIGIRDSEERWSLALFADNLFNTHATTGNQFSTTGVTIPTTRALAVNRPRTIGINLKAGF